MRLGGWLYLLAREICGWGGLTAAGCRRRESVRMQAAKLFEQKIKPPEVARRLRVSRKSAYQWHQMWRDGGARALAGGLGVRG
ncbi:helix-turn-helix domain-containing protein [Streptomyces hygroscopicus]|uniref:helix-turn-helix domain-containing protein n=1 Tax=Streptomyces hygroscopicus TaxID=1912 RepID=UPI003A0FE71C